MTSHPSTSSSPGFDSLDKTEIFWRDNFTWFKDQGYQLRSRFTPDWIPSWKGTNKFRMQCEDGYPLQYGQINDAVHIPTGSRVALKKLYKEDHPFEEDIARYLSSDPLSKDSRNHCVPLLDVLHPPLKGDDEDVQILVMPFLRPFDSPIFDTFGEAIECIRQLFEGLQFMHENRVAHRDLKLNNFMIESEKLFPDGYHPARDLRKSDLSGPAKFYTRTQCPSRYFIIDFGMSRRYEPDDDSPVEPTVTEEGVQLQNPFQVDVHLAGELIRQVFMDGHPVYTSVRGYAGFEFLRPLISDMIQDDPTKRPKMDEVIKRFEDIVRNLSAWKLRSRTSSRRANIFQDIGHVFSHWRRRIVFVTKRTPAIPGV